MMLTPPVAEVILDYTNWKGERRLRRVLPRELWYGVTNYHREPQWFIRGVDLEKNAVRDFALRDIHGTK